MSDSPVNPAQDAVEAFEKLLDGLEQIPSQITVPLKPPVRWAGGEFRELVLREPKADELRQAQEQLRNGSTPSALSLYEQHLVTKVSGAPFQVVQQIGIARLRVCMVYINSFLGVGLATGFS